VFRLGGFEDAQKLMLSRGFRVLGKEAWEGTYITCAAPHLMFVLHSGDIVEWVHIHVFYTVRTLDWFARQTGTSHGVLVLSFA
jgi:hypothetical protein